VSPKAVRQGVLGSCYFHASIAAVAQAAPDKLRGAIIAIPSGGYRVHFSQGPDEVVLPEDVEYGRTHSFDRSEGQWVGVLMRAYAQRAVRLSLAAAIQKSTLIPDFAKPVAIEWLQSSGPLLVAYDRAIRSVVNQNGMMDKAAFKQALAQQLSTLGVTGAEAQTMAGFLDEKGFFDALVLTVDQNGEVFGAYKSMGQGDIPVRVIEAFMGSARAGFMADQPPLVKQLQRLHQGGVALVAGTWGKPPNAQFTVSNWWVAAHVFTVLDYDESAGTVSLRNPWGTRPAPDGSFTIPLADFLGAYESYSYSD
jgi:hypothetical protein